MMGAQSPYQGTHFTHPWGLLPPSMATNTLDIEITHPIGEVFNHYDLLSLVVCFQFLLPPFYGDDHRSIRLGASS